MLLSVRDFKISARWAGSVKSRLVGSNIDLPALRSEGITTMLFDCVDMLRSKDLCASAVAFENASGVNKLEKSSSIRRREGSGRCCKKGMEGSNGGFIYVAAMG